MEMDHGGSGWSMVSRASRTNRCVLAAGPGRAWGEKVYRARCSNQRTDYLRDPRSHPRGQRSLA
eukprot:7253035-Prymnesium_polylepis.2